MRKVRDKSWDLLIAPLMEEDGGARHRKADDRAAHDQAITQDKSPEQRRPGLWMVAAQGGEFDPAREVGEARAHLIKLLRDPYYKEALDELSREGHELLKRKRGPALPRGHAAEKIQRSAVERTRPGRPAGLDLRNFLMAVDRHSAKRGMTLVDMCRVIVKRELHGARKGRIEALAKDLAQRLRNERKKPSKAR
jgi:hypothetical protein